jgi:four helix bundle protein
MTYEEWESQVPAEVRGDTLCKLTAYRQSLFLADLAWPDAAKLLRDRRAVEVADQLVRAAGKISANIAEGYSRGTGRERARFYGYALGLARETRDWYYKSRSVLGPRVTAHRLELTTQIIRLALTMVSSERATNRRL